MIENHRTWRPHNGTIPTPSIITNMHTHTHTSRFDYPHISSVCRSRRAVGRIIKQTILEGANIAVCVLSRAAPIRQDTRTAAAAAVIYDSAQQLCASRRGDWVVVCTLLFVLFGAIFVRNAGQQHRRASVRRRSGMCVLPPLHVYCWRNCMRTHAPAPHTYSNLYDCMQMPGSSGSGASLCPIRVPL